MKVVPGNNFAEVVAIGVSRIGICPRCDSEIHPESTVVGRTSTQAKTGQLASKTILKQSAKGHVGGPLPCAQIGSGEVVSRVTEHKFIELSAG